MNKHSGLQVRTASSSDLVGDASDAPDVRGHVVCNICRHDIPLSEAFVPEAVDYVVHFCGLDCFDLWLNRKNCPTRDH
jgi:Domain of unknown function (DUF3330)